VALGGASLVARDIRNVCNFATFETQLTFLRVFLLIFVMLEHMACIAGGPIIVAK